MMSLSYVSGSWLPPESMRKVKTTVSNDIHGHQLCSIGCLFTASEPMAIIALALILLTNDLSEIKGAFTM